jgi:arylsulfatase
VSDLRYTLGRPLKASKEADLSEIELPDLTKRRMFRGIFDGRYKYIRYFAPARYNQPVTIEEIKQDNDLALYDLIQDPGEMRNLANPRVAGYDENLLLEMNNKLNHLITTEIVVDKPLHDLIISRSKNNQAKTI